MTYKVDFPFYPRCFECGGRIELSQRSGRSREITKGVRVPIPDDFPIPTCESCGDEVWSTELSEALDGLLNKQLGDKIRGYISILSERHDVTQSQIASACRVGHTYLSSVAGGHKTPSGMLLEFLQILVDVDGAFEHASSELTHGVLVSGDLVVGPRLANVFHFPLKYAPGQESASAGTFGTETASWVANDCVSNNCEHSVAANVG
jgi:hypothetical protein